jgi:hypothetical protein
VISWKRNLDDIENADEKEQHNAQVVIESPQVLFCGKEGSIEICSECKNYSECYDQHCVAGGNNYAIDIISTKLGFNVYVMIDDDFWHGLTRNMDLINNPQSEIDALISQVYFRDSVFNNECKKKNILLVRFSARDISLFLMLRKQELIPYFATGPKTKIKKFFKMLNSSISLFGEETLK